MKIVIVDDDQSILKMLEMHLSDFGDVTSILIDNPSLAEQRILNESPDVILLDLKMGPPTGRDVIERLKVIGLTTPVVVMSGFVTLSVKSDLQRLGIKNILYKPFELKELDAMLGLRTNGSKR